MKPLRVYSTDLSFYTNYIEKLVEEAHAGFSPAIKRFAEYVPRLATLSHNDIPNAKLTVEDAQCVYAREHGFDHWAEFAEFVNLVAKDGSKEPFVEFIHAVEGDHIDVVEKLLDQDPDLIHHVASTHKSPLHSCPSVELTSLLLSRGAPADLETPLPGGTPLVHALIWGRTKKAETIAVINLAPENMRVAAGLGRIDLLEKMWQKNGSLISEAKSGRTYYRPNYGWFPWTPGDSDQEVLDEALIYAATNGQINAAQYLIDRGANVDGLAYETRPLIRAAWRGQTETIDWLLDHGASIDATGWLGGHAKGTTALHIAASIGDLALVKHLLDRGANLHIRDQLYNGKPDGWADNFGHTEVRDFLQPLCESQK